MALAMSSDPETDPLPSKFNLWSKAESATVTEGKLKAITEDKKSSDCAKKFILPERKTTSSTSASAILTDKVSLLSRLGNSCKGITIRPELTFRSLDSTLTLTPV